MVMAGLALSLASTSLAFGQFAVDIEQEAFRKKVGQRLVRDLAVGESGKVRYVYFCVDDRRLMMNGEAELEENRNDYSISWTVKRTDEKSVTLEADVTQSQKPQLKRDLLRRLRMLRNCRDPERESGPQQQLYQVMSLAGTRSMSEVLAIPD
ncbi:hypothetical protein MAUB1S_10582 [Mycolicibacterium aubagnense]